MNPTPPVSPRDALAEFAKAFPSTVTDPERVARERDLADEPFDFFGPDDESPPRHVGQTHCADCGDLLDYKDGGLCINCLL